MTRKNHDCSPRGPSSPLGRSVRSVIFFGETEFVRSLRHDTDYHLRRSCTILVASCFDFFFRIISIVDDRCTDSIRQYLVSHEDTCPVLKIFLSFPSLLIFTLCHISVSVLLQVARKESSILSRLTFQVPSFLLLLSMIEKSRLPFVLDKRNCSDFG